MAETTPKPPAPLVCVACACTHFILVGSRTLPDGRIQQRRRCRYCGRLLVRIEGTARPKPERLP